MFPCPILRAGGYRGSPTRVMFVPVRLSLTCRSVVFSSLAVETQTLKNNVACEQNNVNSQETQGQSLPPVVFSFK